MAVAAVKPRTRSATVAAPTFTGMRSGQSYALGLFFNAAATVVIYTVARRPELVAKIQKHAFSGMTSTSSTSRTRRHARSVDRRRLADGLSEEPLGGHRRLRHAAHRRGPSAL
jgi:hypothetical protein